MDNSAAARRAIYVQRYASHLAKQFQNIFAGLRKQISLGLMDKAVTESLIAQLEMRQRTIFQDFERRLYSDLKAFAVDEMEFEALMAMRSAGVNLRIPPDLWQNIITNPLVFQGTSDTLLLEPFIKNWTEAQIRRVSGFIRTGSIMGDTNYEITKKISKYLNKTATRSLQAIVRTATNHIANEAILAVYQANPDVIVGYKWTSTIDNRTSDICKGLDGKKFYFKDNPKLKPPAHPNCRSRTIAILAEDYQ